MNMIRNALAAGSLALASGASAGDLETVQTFYDLLSDPFSEALTAAFIDGTSPDWESVGDYSGTNKSREAFLAQLGGFAQLMPDLEWAVMDMHDASGFVTVRSRATATPTGPFFGVDGQGRGFDIMAIDIHQLEGGKIVRTWHVEDWASARQQLSGQ